MRLIAHESSRVTILFPFEEVVPIGGADGKAIVAAIAHKYEFLHLPDLSVGRDELNKNGLVFESGAFDHLGDRSNIHSLKVYNDGVNIDALTTEAAEAFWNELLNTIRTEYGFREFVSHPRKYFWSQVVVEFDNRLSNLLSSYEKIVSKIRSAVAPTYGENISNCWFARLDLRWDSTDRKNPDPAPRFTIERRNGVPFDQERYFCGAPMQTKEHISILEMIESLAN